MTAADWNALATGTDTLVVYMVVAALEEFCAQLTRGGRAPGTPVALIENGSRPEQRVLLGRLDGIAALATAHAVQSPALLVVGEVAALGHTLHWFGAAPISAESGRRTEPLRALAS
jgi:uroporphyrin-III C-methyltransferase/precorrin-2 dehydrogenase/sirohydrochlorin ferrochelatase